MLNAQYLIITIRSNMNNMVAITALNTKHGRSERFQLHRRTYEGLTADYRGALLVLLDELRGILG